MCWQSSKTINVTFNFIAMSKAVDRYYIRDSNTSFYSQFMKYYRLIFYIFSNKLCSYQ